ncbi:MAG: hypothetical protein GF388_02700 [Candidatus Aegiribacteria sp.]|nr:hypothetical protein [Candidatus Aegiribacteria sp.]MBD3294205.1 hypothetical protein [Candidatus Fermentibacteria bacterium]
MKTCLIAVLMIFAALSWCDLESQSIEAAERADSLLDAGDIAGGIEALNRIHYNDGYYEEDWMEARLLMLVGDSARTLTNRGNTSEALQLFESLTVFRGMNDRWYISYSDSSDYADRGYSEFIDVDEYADILTGYAYLLQLADRFFQAEQIYAKVIALRPHLAETYLAMGDLHWELGEPAESQSFYWSYLELESQRIPGRVRDRIEVLNREAEESVPIEILAERTLPIETHQLGEPILIDSLSYIASGGVVIHASSSSFLLVDSAVTVPDGWAMEADDTDGSINVIVEEHGGAPRFRITFEENYAGQRLTAFSENGDELWICDLEGTDEYDNAIHISEISGGGYMLSPHPSPALSRETIRSTFCGFRQLHVTFPEFMASQ